MGKTEHPRTEEDGRPAVPDRQAGAAPVRLTHAMVLSDLQEAKRRAFEQDELAIAVRAAEVQGRAIGLFREPDPNAVRRMSDEDLIRNIAGENEQVAAALRESLATGRPCRA